MTKIKKLFFITLLLFTFISAPNASAVDEARVIEFQDADFVFGNDTVQLQVATRDETLAVVDSVTERVLFRLTGVQDLRVRPGEKSIQVSIFRVTDGRNDFVGDFSFQVRRRTEEIQFSIRLQDFETAREDYEFVIFNTQGLPVSKYGFRFFANNLVGDPGPNPIDNPLNNPNPPISDDVLSYILSKITVLSVRNSNFTSVEKNINDDFLLRIPENLTDVQTAAGGSNPFDDVQVIGIDIDAQGTFAGRSAFDDEAQGFTYLTTDTGELCVKASDATADWPNPCTSVRGEQGPQGEQGLQGPIGPGGPTGGAGPAGATGATGPQGVAGPGIIQDASATFPTCDGTRSGEIRMDTAANTGLLYICDTTRTPNKWLSVEEYSIWGENSGTCNAGLDVDTDPDCNVDWGGSLGSDTDTMGFYITRNMTVTGVGFSEDNDACTSGSFDLEIWGTNSTVDDTSYTLQQEILTGLVGEAENSNTLNVDISGPQYLNWGLDNNCGQNIDDWNMIIYYRWMHP